MAPLCLGGPSPEGPHSPLPVFPFAAQKGKNDSTLPAKRPSRLRLSEHGRQDEGERRAEGEGSPSGGKGGAGDFCLCRCHPLPAQHTVWPAAPCPKAGQSIAAERGKLRSWFSLELTRLVLILVPQKFLWSFSSEATGVKKERR